MALLKDPKVKAKNTKRKIMFANENTIYFTSPFVNYADQQDQIEGANLATGMGGFNQGGLGGPRGPAPAIEVIDRGGFGINLGTNIPQQAGERAGPITRSRSNSVSAVGGDGNNNVLSNLYDMASRGLSTYTEFMAPENFGIDLSANTFTGMLPKIPDFNFGPGQRSAQLPAPTGEAQTQKVTSEMSKGSKKKSTTSRGVKNLLN